MCVTGDVFYVIEEGTFTIFDNSGRELARVSKGSCFGELALLHQVSMHFALESCTIHALGAHVALSMHQDSGGPGSGAEMMDASLSLRACGCAGCKGSQCEGADRWRPACAASRRLQRHLGQSDAHPAYVAL